LINTARLRSAKFGFGPCSCRAALLAKAASLRARAALIAGANAAKGAPAGGPEAGNKPCRSK